MLYKKRFILWIIELLGICDVIPMVAHKATILDQLLKFDSFGKMRKMNSKYIFASVKKCYIIRHFVAIL